MSLLLGSTLLPGDAKQSNLSLKRIHSNKIQFGFSYQLLHVDPNEHTNLSISRILLAGEKQIH